MRNSMWLIIRPRCFFKNKIHHVGFPADKGTQKMDRTLGGMGHRQAALLQMQSRNSKADELTIVHALDFSTVFEQLEISEGFG